MGEVENRRGGKGRRRYFVTCQSMGMLQTVKSCRRCTEFVVIGVHCTWQLSWSAFVGGAGPSALHLTAAKKKKASVIDERVWGTHPSSTCLVIADRYQYPHCRKFHQSMKKKHEKTPSQMVSRVIIGYIVVRDQKEPLLWHHQGAAKLWWCGGGGMNGASS